MSKTTPLSVKKGQPRTKPQPKTDKINEQPKKKGGHNKHIPSEENIKDVTLMTKYGVQTKYIAAHVGISEPTLFVHYKDIMQKAKADAHMKVGMSLYQKAISGDVTAQIWYSKTQMEWTEKLKVEQDTNVTHNVPDSELARQILFALTKGAKND